MVTVSRTRMCRICSRPEDEHHDFQQALEFPEDCVCDPLSWDMDMIDEILPICGSYTKGGATIDEVTYCSVCDHARECHKG